MYPEGVTPSLARDPLAYIEHPRLRSEWTARRVLEGKDDRPQAGEEGRTLENTYQLYSM
jgi:hypothetical protein